jgi:hypothetical protein
MHSQQSTPDVHTRLPVFTCRIFPYKGESAWLELEELGIDDDMLVALDLSAKFPV